MGSKRLLGSLFRRDHADRADLYFRKGIYSKAAECYVKAKRWQQAAEAYIQLEDIDTAVEMYSKAGDLLTAGELLHSRHRPKEAISYFEKAGAYRKAAEACLEVKQYIRAGRLFEQAAMYRRAAECFDQGGEIENALGAWELEVARLRRQETSDSSEQQIRQLDLHRAEVLARLGRTKEAAQLLDQHGFHARAAQLYERAEKFDDAARSYLAADRPDDANRVFERSGSTDDLLRAEIFSSLHRYLEAAELFERLDRFEEAAEAYEKSEDWERAAELWEVSERPDRAAELYLRLGRLQEAGLAFAMAERHEDAARAFCEAGDTQNAAAAYQAADNLLEAGRRYLQAGLKTAAREVLQEIAGDHPDFIPAAVELLPLLLDENRAAEAEQRLRILEALSARGDIEIEALALAYWRGRLAEQRGDLPESRALYEQVVAQKPEYADTATRLEDLRRRQDSGSMAAQPVADDKSTDTQPILLPAEENAPDQARGANGERPAAEASTADPSTADPSTADPSMVDPSAADPSAADLPARSSTLEPAFGDLPFKLDERLESWWPGLALFRATDLRQNSEALLGSLPLAEIGLEVEDFRRAMKRVMPVDHPVVLKLDEVIIASDKVLLLYEPFVGQTLSRRLAEGSLPLVSALFLLSQLCEGLATAHQIGITHQWLSPQTILVDDHSRIKIAGLGMREILAHRDTTSRAYLSPELRRGEEVIGPASDVYSLGLLAVELLQAQLPADWSEDQALDAKTVLWSPEVEEAVHQGVREQFIRCLSLNPLERPSTAELKTSLATFGLMPGQILVDRYEILCEVGRGGMSRVYRAFDRELEDEVAIKTVLTPTFGRSEDADRLLQEVRICRKITHSNVVRVHDFGRFPGGIFIIMEFLEGPGLDRVIAEESPLPLARVRDILSDINAALAEAHQLDIVHRDLKPANVIFHRDRLRVMDFGIARMGDGPQQLTQTGQVIGSPRYMAPEQIQGLPLNGTCDLYALGVIAYTMLAGREPFVAENTTSIVLKHLHEAPPDIRQFRSDLPEPWVRMLSDLLAKKPAQRLQSAEQLAAILEALPVDGEVSTS